MRIYDVNLTGPSVSESGRAQEAHKTGTSRTGGPNAGGSDDRVELSSTLGRLSQALAGYESSRNHHVAALTKQYQTGNYRPDAMATSRGMVSEALAMGAD